ncbi:hypothetical protein VT84_30835 [Gemmata sp. SH-PL17]|uniref:hypothetical protein n=1 Tax=Gemmata sp. SH-PL17 TaxID=1630693 RepID=UPI00078CF127|nr:hypothetical protein [Gemmata sp. SH-PL17]AMV28830.1 hypothetical protein VT84_30835 [Gemmata sp. SH-PL17]
MAISDQINTRVDPAMKARYDAAAAVLGKTASTVYREVLESHLEEVERQADEAAKQRGKWPGNVPATLVEEALERHLKSISRTEPLRLSPSELYGPESKALWTLLSWIWAEDDGSETKVRAKLTKWLESLDISAEVMPYAAQPTADMLNKALPTPRKVRSYPRSSSGDGE